MWCSIPSADAQPPPSRAERLKRQWIGIDISPKAAELVTTRLQGILDEIPLYKDGSVIHRTDQPIRSDMGKLPKPRSHLDLLWGRQSGLCGGCGVQFDKRNMTVDHIVPRAHGGTDHLDNLWLLCGACQLVQGNALSGAVPAEAHEAPRCRIPLARRARVTGHTTESRRKMDDRRQLELLQVLRDLKWNMGQIRNELYNLRTDARADRRFRDLRQQAIPEAGYT